MNRRLILYILLIMAMATTMIPGLVFAADGEDGQGTQFEAVITPENPTVQPGESVELNVIITGGNPEAAYTYQWFEIEEATAENKMIEGAESASLTIDHVTWKKRLACSVTDSSGNNIWPYCEVTVDNGLAMDTDRSYIDISYGEDAEMSVAATANQGKISYQWFVSDIRDGQFEERVLIEGANQASYTAVNITDDKLYYCRATDDYGNNLEKEFYVIPDSGLKATTEKESFYVSPGESVTMSVTASNDTNTSIRYSWVRETYDPVKMDVEFETLEGETEPKLTIANANHSYGYRCIVKDDFSNERTVYFRVNVDYGLTIDSFSGDGWVPYGESRELNVNASVKEGGIIYQWFEFEPETGGRTPIEGASESSFLIPKVTGESHAYCCYVMDDYGNYTYETFYISVDYGLRITKQPVNTSVSKGGDTLLSVQATVNEEARLKGDAQLQYQWYSVDAQEEKLKGETGPTLEVKNVRNNRMYYCVVSDGHEKYNSSQQSETVTVSVDTELDVRTNGHDVVIKNGETKKLIVDAVSTEKNITYKWMAATKEEVSRSVEPTDPKKPWEMVLKGTAKNYKDETYWCEVSDGIHKETVSFWIIWDYGFKVDHQKQVNVAPGESCKLKVKAASDLKGNTFTYRWDRFFEEDDDGTVTQVDRNEGYAGLRTNTLTIGKCNESGLYRCSVVDKFHEVEEVYVNVNVDNGFSVSNEEETSLKAGETGVLKVDVQAKELDGMTYVWKKKVNSRQWKTIKDCTTNTMQCTESGSYSCIVTDKYNNSKTAWFNVTVDSGLEVEKEVTIHAIDGEMLSLHANATTRSEKGLTYAWYLDDWEQEASKDTITVIAGKYRQVRCRVSDGYNTEWVDFNIQMNGEFQAKADGQDSFDVAYGDEVTCKVAVTGAKASDLDYTWIGIDGKAIGSAVDQDTCTVKARKSGTIVCQVRDGKGMQEIPFKINVKTGLKLAYDQTVTTTAAKPLTLKVQANGSTSGRIPSYIWYEADGDDEENLKELYYRSDADWEFRALNNTLTVRIPKKATYICLVDDGVTTAKAVIHVQVDPNETALMEEYMAAVQNAEGIAAELAAVINKKGGKALVEWESSDTYTGVQIRYCANKNFAKGVKTTQINDQETRKTVVKKLKKGKTWYFQIRTFTKVPNPITGQTKPIYGMWSETKPAAIKK